MRLGLFARARLRAPVIVSLLFVATAGLGAQKPKPPVKPKPAAPASKAPPPAPTPAEAPKPQQWKVVSRYVADGHDTITTVYAEGTRQRVELPASTAIITQCDLGRAVQVNDRARAYAIVPFAAAASGPATAAASPAKPGASVLVRTVGTDTGERREIFGQQTRHLKLVTTTEPSPQACDKKKGRVETDGWFANIPELQECAGAKALRAPVEPVGTCRDPRVEEHAGITIEGFPLAYSVISFDAAGKESSKLVVEVTALTRENLSAPLFDPPSTYAALPDADALAAAARRAELEELGTTAKLAGMTRIGVAPPIDRSGKASSADAIRSDLLEEFNVRPFEAIPLAAGTPEEQQAEARKKECDYVVRAELGSLTTSAPGKVGGLVRRASGGGTPTELHEAGVALDLVPVGTTGTRAKKTASAKTGAFTWSRAVGLARFAGRIYFGMTGGMMMSMMNMAGGTGGGGPLGGGDPSINAIMMLLGPKAAADAPVDLATPAAVIAAAFHKAATDLMKDLQPK
jgi:hypothetical protein